MATLDSANENIRSFRSLDEIPAQYQSIFSSYSYFNAVQSKILDEVLYTDNSLVISAPTGSGKTVAFELAIIKLLRDFQDSNLHTFKMVYISPVKALCKERFDDWNTRFAPLGVQCVQITGDGGDIYDVQGYNLIITTPEKWDSLTRKWRDNAGLVKLVRLFMIDEVHLLSESKRGPVLEAIVCRMKTVAKALNLPFVRFVVVSATIHNVEDLALWLGSNNLPAYFHKFGNESRPVPLEKKVIGFACPSKDTAFFFDVQLSYKIKALILQYSKGKPSLVFCSTRKSVCQTSKILSEQLTFHFTESQRSILTASVSSLVDHKLKELVLNGIGYHHAGLTLQDRQIIQDMFVNGNLPILVATSTLSMGVNLPAHLVIIKSTQQFIAGKVEEYSESAILQMIGRAGRPQFDTEATAIIMTKMDLVGKYERILESREIVESSLHLHLTEHLNSEIVLLTITDLGVAMDWIRHTFLYVRALKNPKHYGFDQNADKIKIEKTLEAICLKEINALKKAGLIEVDSNGLDISPTANGRLMSHFYLSFETFKIFLELTQCDSVPELVNRLSDAGEFSDVQLRLNERTTLNKLNGKQMLKYPIQGKIKTKSMKVNCLIQASLGSLPIQDPALHNEAGRVVKIAERLVKCLSEFLSRNPVYKSILTTTVFAKCLHANLWEDSPYVSRQLERIGPTLGSLLSASGKTTFQAIEEANARDLERIINRAPPFGNVIQNAVRHLPKYTLDAELLGVDSRRYRARITVSLLNAEETSIKNTAGDRHALTLIIGDTNDSLVHCGHITDQILMRKDFGITISHETDKLPYKMIIDLISNQWVGIDVKKEVIISPEACPPVAEPEPAPPKAPARKRKTPSENKKISEFGYLSHYFGKVKNANAGLEKRKILPARIESKTQEKIGGNPKRLKENKEVPFVSCFDIDVVVESDDDDDEPMVLPQSSSKSNSNIDSDKTNFTSKMEQPTSSAGSGIRSPLANVNNLLSNSGVNQPFWNSPLNLESRVNSSYSLKDLYESLKKARNTF